MPEEFTDYDVLLTRIRQLIRERSPRLIGIEGYMASGKSHLAKRLASGLNAKGIHLDDYLFAQLYPDRDRSHLDAEPYVNCLDLEELSRQIAETSGNSPLVIIDGICLRDALEKIERRADITVYIKCVTRDGLWHDDLRLEDFEAGKEKPRKLQLDQLEYHSRVRPHEKADLVLIRPE